MRLIRSILEKHGSIVTLGEQQASLDKDRLQSDLLLATRSTDRYLQVAVVMLVTLFLCVSVTTVWSIWRGHDAVVLGSFGITSAGLVYLMIRLWRQRVALELLVVLVRGTDATTTATLVAILRDHLSAPDRA